MPVSKKRKKKGKKVQGSGRAWTRDEILQEAQRPAGVTFQDLINVLAVQEYQKDPEAYNKAHPAPDDKQEETEDGRQGSSGSGSAVQRGEEERGES